MTNNTSSNKSNETDSMTLDMVREPAAATAPAGPPAGSVVVPAEAVGDGAATSVVTIEVRALATIESAPPRAM